MTRLEPHAAVLRDGRTLTLRSPEPADAEELIRYMADTARETHFILRTPQECEMTVEQETAFIQGVNESSHDMMICAFVDGKLAGNCHVKYGWKVRVSHRGSVAIALRKEFWGLGIGTRLMAEMIAQARAWGLHHLELEYVEGNERARRLYEKMGFRQTFVNPDAIRLEDGTMLALIGMQRGLNNEQEE